PCLPHLRKYFIRQNPVGPRRAAPPAEGTAAPEADFHRELLAAEERSLGSTFRRVVEFYERWLRRALAQPLWLAIFCAVLIVAAMVGYRFLGSDLMPEMEEGGFILDYWTPPGSSLDET